MLRFRVPEKRETEVLLDLAVETGIFEQGEVKDLLGRRLSQYFDSKLSGNQIIRVVENLSTKSIEGWTYFAESTAASAFWDIWWIGIKPTSHGTGSGQFLLGAIENEIAIRNGKKILIETSSDKRLERAIGFYQKSGYKIQETIHDFYAPGISKIIFCKCINSKKSKKQRTKLFYKI